MIRRITPREVQQKLEAGERLVFVDVREPDEHAICRIEGSELIPLGELARRTDDLPADDGVLLVVYCHHGIRSLSAVAMLHAAGIENAASLNGGIDAWSLQIDPAVPRY